MPGPGWLLQLQAVRGQIVVQVGTTWNPQLAAMTGLKKVNPSEFGGISAFMPANYESLHIQGESYGVPWFAETRLPVSTIKTTLQRLSLSPPPLMTSLWL